MRYEIALVGVLCAAAATAADLGQTTITADVHTAVDRIARDQKRDFFDFPAQVAHGKHWKPVLLVSAGTAGLLLADRYDAGYFRRTSTFTGFDRVMSGTTTALAIMAAPAALYAAGTFEGDIYAKQSAVMAGEAAVDGEIAGEFLKLATRRRRPQDFPADGTFGNSFGHSSSALDSSFPSSHAIGAFSVATVLSERYGARHRWVPLLAYASAGAIAFSRVSGSAHFASDVFLGAAIGWATGHSAGLNEVR